MSILRERRLVSLFPICLDCLYTLCLTEYCQQALQSILFYENHNQGLYQQNSVLLQIYLDFVAMEDIEQIHFNQNFYYKTLSKLVNLVTILVNSPFVNFFEEARASPPNTEQDIFQIFYVEEQNSKILQQLVENFVEDSIFKIRNDQFIILGDSKQN